MDDLYQNQRIFSSNIKDIGGWGYIERSCKYQSNRNYCRYALVIPTVPRKGLSWQDLVSCDYFRKSVVFRGLDICNIVGDIQDSDGHQNTKMPMIYHKLKAIRSNEDITGRYNSLFQSNLKFWLDKICWII